jgi:hypothetical protein
MHLEHIGQLLCPGFCPVRNINITVPKLGVVFKELTDDVTRADKKDLLFGSL